MTYNPKTTLILLLLIVLVGAGILGYIVWDANRPPTIRSSVNEGRALTEIYLKTYLSYLMPEGEKVKMRGRIFWDSPYQAQVVSPGFSFRAPPDEHASAMYTIARVDQDGVVFEYQTEFDHRSFGRNLITRDSGSFKLPWFESPATLPARSH